MTLASAASRRILLAVASLVAVLVAAQVGIKRYQAHRAEQAALAEQAAQRVKMDALAGQVLRRKDVAPPRLDGEFPCVAATVSEGKAYPRLEKCALPVTPTGPVDRFEVDLRFGSFIVRQSDLYLDDVFEAPLTRTYNSREVRQECAFGWKTNHPFDIEPVGTRRPYTYMMLQLEDGNFLFFDRVSPGTGFEDAIFQHTETATRFYRAVISWNGSGWTAWLTDGSRMQFPEAYNAKTVAQGSATEMTDALGRRLELRRDEQRNLQEVRTPHGHSIKLAYGDQNRISRARDDRGRWAQYQYDSRGMLTDVALSSGLARHYSYDGSNMTQVDDENRQPLVKNSYYEGGYLRSQVFGNGETYSYRYTGAPNVPYALSVTVIRSDGTQSDVELASSVPAAIKHPPN